MNREQYIEKLLAIYKLRYKPSEVEIAEFKLLLEMMPDDTPKTITDVPFKPLDITIPQPPISVAYGCLPPVHVMYGVNVSDVTYKANSTYTSSSTVGKDDNDG